MILFTGYCAALLRRSLLLLAGVEVVFTAHSWLSAVSCNLVLTWTSISRGIDTCFDTFRHFSVKKVKGVLVDVSDTFVNRTVKALNYSTNQYRKILQIISLKMKQM